MERKTLFGSLAILFFVAMLFTPTDSNLWIYFLILGIVSGIGWFKS
jgi:hypothetical protein